MAPGLISSRVISTFAITSHQYKITLYTPEPTNIMGCICKNQPTSWAFASHSLLSLLLTKQIKVFCSVCHCDKKRQHTHISFVLSKIFGLQRVGPFYSNSNHIHLRLNIGAKNLLKLQTDFYANTVVPRSYAAPNYAIFAATLFWIGSKKNSS